MIEIAIADPRTLLSSSIAIDDARIVRQRPSKLETPDGSSRFAQSTDVEHLAAFGDVRQEHIHERVLTVERRAPLIFGSHDPLDCRQIAFTECVVLRAKETFSPSVGLSGVDPIIHSSPTYERRHPFGAVPRVKQQSIAVVRAIIDR